MMPFNKLYTVEKTVVDAGWGWTGPYLRTICKIQINTVEEGTPEDQLEELCGCKVNEEIEIELGKTEGDISCIIDVLLQKMKRDSKLHCSIKYHDHSLFMPGETITFMLCLLSWKESSLPIYKLKPDTCLSYALENKEAGTRLFKQSRPYVAACFYSQAIKYLIVATTSSDKLISDKLREEAKDLHATCHVNLAACLLKFELYPEVIANCNDALILQANNLKALYRRAICFLAISDLENAEKDISQGLKLDNKNKAFLNLSMQQKEKTASANAQLSSRLKTLFT